MTVAGGTVVVLMLCAVPFLKQLKAWFSHTPASWVVWLAIAGLLLACPLDNRPNARRRNLGEREQCFSRHSFQGGDTL